ncbi:platelet-activating factor acetylhydrolase IB subunit gamma isoform X1 [Hemiscyllium ocellatum]|uniref:platelet-activating factor acetylhydrolase IB subunit gamma isoform X1 n=2 Tax=Hemiscyllium ocellatum TaxID=170820 RepID=UPI0029663E95|nr:platelet-activating factor acetylhydrolase IB subunit gamma isoform X1 [Hemiscyllium ocellatum]
MGMIALLEDREHPGRFSALFADTMSGGDNNPAAIPVAVPDVQGDGRWMSQHNRFVADTKDKEPDVLFVGDSLVQLLHQFEIWRQLFSPLHALNFGIGGDATQNVLWRIQHGELENIKPKVIVLWVGTNNHGHTAEQVAGGIEAIVRLMIQQQPLAKIVILGLLPRGKDPNPLRVKNAQVNELVKEMVKDISNASYLDVDPGFVNSDGTISHNDMYDYLHLTRHAYSSVCQVIHARVQQLLAEAASDPLNPGI